jgi:hypothetical protein
MEVRELKKLLQEPYKTENWRTLLSHVFDNVQFLSSPIPIPTGDHRVKELKQYGTVQLKDGKNLALFELTLNNEVNLIRNRVGLNELVKKFIDQDAYHGILSIFEQGKEDYRFTFTARNIEFDAEEGFIDRDTDTKRFTYILGKNESCRTAAERFDILSKKNEKTIKAVEEAFNVEKLSKKFFTEYIEQFHRLVNYLKDRPTYFQAVFENDLTATRNYVKRLMGRLVFLKFIQKKGWLGVPVTEKNWGNGDFNFLESSFSKAKIENRASTFVSQFLNPLFYEALNKGGRINDEFQNSGYKIPHLSGGLFESENPKDERIDFEEEELTSLFEFFGRYNFTIDENDVNDKEVGIDPEMLGHIFENLLEDNKDKGAFYTPKEIVRFMCQESLKEYLKTYLERQGKWPQNKIEEDELKTTIKAFVEKKETARIARYDKEVATALRDVKICDPAIGSGAFPMGLLNEIFVMTRNLHEESPDRVGAVWGMQGDSWQPNLVKQNIIQNSIYGVDIESGAVDIARLRFWLSLVIEEDEPKPLPHLNYKIVVGNSLVSKLENTIIDIEWNLQPKLLQTDIFGNEGKLTERKEILREISQLQKKIFEPNSDEGALSIAIRDKKIDLLILQLGIMIDEKGVEEKPQGTSRNVKLMTEKWLETLGWKQQIKNLRKMKGSDKTPLDFFDWLLDFPEVMNPEINPDSGFDIVIGNPPYLRVQGLRNFDSKLVDELVQKYDSTTGSFDLYAVFLERSFQLMNDKGIINFIMPTKWTNAAFGKGLRKVVSNKNSAFKIIDFKAFQVFNASTYTGIQWFKNYSDNLSYYQLDKDLISNYDLGKYLFSLDPTKSAVISKDSLNDDSWILTDPKTLEILNKLHKYPRRLSDIFEKIFQGLATSKDDVYFLYDVVYDGDLVKGYSKQINGIVAIEKPFTKPLLKGKDVHRYDSIVSDKAVIFPYEITKDKSRLYEEAEISTLFPLGYKYLKKCEEVLRAREKGRFNIDGKWFQFGRKQAIVSSQKEKLIAPEISIGGNYSYDKKGQFYTTTKIYGYIKYKDVKENYLFWLGLLNSRLFWFYIRSTGYILRGGYFTFKTNYIEPFPVPERIDESIYFRIHRKVNKILNDSKYNEGKTISKLEREIDFLLYKLYDLNSEYIAHIERKASIDRC